MWRGVVVLLLLAVAAGAVTGSAASLPVASAQLGSGPAPVTTCDTDGVTATYQSVLLVVTGVVVRGIADGSATKGSGACDGATVTVAVLGSDGQVIAGATGSAVDAGDLDALDDDVLVLLGSPPPTSAVAGARIRLIG